MNEIVPADTHTELISLSDRAKSLVIKTVEDANFAANMRGSSKLLQKKIKEFFAPHKKAADELHANLCASEKKELAPLQEVDSVIDGKLRIFNEEQEASQKREQERLDAEARKRAEDEALAASAELEAQGNKDAARAILDAPLAVPAVQAQREAVAGVSFRDNYKADVVDLMALVKAVAAGNAPLSLLMADMSSLKKFANATKGAIPVSGVRFYSQKVIAQTR